MKSWRTTVLGIIAALVILLTQAQAVLDDDPGTGVDWTKVAEALAILGIGVVARDNKVTSEQAGAKRW